MSEARAKKIHDFFHELGIIKATFVSDNTKYKYVFINKDMCKFEINNEIITYEFDDN